MQSFLDNRTTLLNQFPFNTDGRYVLYWMQMFKRSTHNFALNKAIQLANELKLPLVVYEGLKFYYPWASDRLHTFILQGVAEKKKAFAEKGIRYVFFLQNDKHAPRDVVAKLAKDAAALVTDDFPCFIIPEHNRHIADRVRIPVFAVDSNGMIPISLLQKEEFAARTIRPKINRLLPDFIQSVRTPHLHVHQPELKLDCPETTVEEDKLTKLVAQCDIDHSVLPSQVYEGGERAARKRLKHFAEHILPGYDELRNKPTVDGSSRLSAYLHFGFISPQQIYEVVQEAEAPAASKEAYLEELIVRRELSYNFTSHNPQYASLDSLPNWAKQTMDKHLKDKRPVVYTPEQMETGTTGDELWNTVQRESLQTGEIHNYMRMLWGKKIIEWSPDYESAFALMEHLNNKYCLDGRNPNSYAGILWCFGKHDRAWGPERPIYGTLRYLSSANWAKKTNGAEYIRKYSKGSGGATLFG